MQHGVVARRQLRDLGITDACRRASGDRRPRPNARWSPQARTGKIDGIRRHHVRPPAAERSSTRTGVRARPWLEHLWTSRVSWGRGRCAPSSSAPSATAEFAPGRHRDGALQPAGHRVARVTATQVADEPEAVLAAIRALLGDRSVPISTRSGKLRGTAPPGGDSRPSASDSFGGCPSTPPS